MTKKAVNERELCLEVIVEILERGEYIHHVLNQVFTKNMYLEKRERSFISRVSEGTVEYLIQLDWVIDHFSKTKVRAMKPFIRNLLRMSVYQILYMDQVPDAAACNEAVKIAVKRGFHGLKGFVNGVLRTISRESSQLVFDSLSVQYAMPQWLVQHFVSEYGEESAKKIFSYFLQPKRTYIRCNISHCTVEELVESLEKDGVIVKKSNYLKEALQIEGYETLYELEAFQKGWFQVQDVSSMFVGKAAMAKQGDCVLDVCAAPGGKTLHIADLLKQSGHVQARDLTQYKVELIDENVERCRFRNITTKVWDATVLDETWIEKADIVIADLPCSGLGVIGRKPDIKYKVTTDKIRELQKLQRKILDVVYRYVKPGGTLIYSTCTISKEENEENVRWLLENYPLKAVSLEGCFDVAMHESEQKRGYIQLLPGIHDCDGFFIAKFKRNE